MDGRCEMMLLPEGSAPQDSKRTLRETWEHSWGKQRSQPVSLDCIQKGPGRPIKYSVSNKPFG